MTLSVSKTMLNARMNTEMGREDALLAKAKGAKGSHAEQKIAKLAEEFESIFVNMMFKTMRKTVQKSGFIDGGNAEDVFKSMLDGEYAKLLAGQRNTGLAGQIEKDLLKALRSQIRIGDQVRGHEQYQVKALRPGENKAKIDSGNSVSKHISQEG